MAKQKYERTKPHVNAVGRRCLWQPCSATPRSCARPRRDAVYSAWNLTTTRQFRSQWQRKSSRPSSFSFSNTRSPLWRSRSMRGRSRI